MRSPMTELKHLHVADVKPLINFLKNIESGSVVLMASFDEPATK